RSASFSPTITNYGDVKVDLSAPRARRLVLVDPCEECLALGQRLVKDGWEVHSAALEGVGMPDSDLGLLRLQTSHVKNLKKVKALINATGMQWVVALPHALLVEPGVAKFIAEWFLDYHTLPFDHSRADIALGRACGMPDSDVGRLRLKNSHVSNKKKGKELINASGMLWVVALPHPLLVEPGEAKFIAEWFHDYHTLPIDHSRVDIAMGRACCMAHLR